MNAVPHEIDDMLRDAGIGVTQQRRTGMAALVQGHDHPNAQDVYARAKLAATRASFATACRALATLADAEIVQRLTVDDGAARFEMSPETERDHLLSLAVVNCLNWPQRTWLLKDHVWPQSLVLKFLVSIPYFGLELQGGQPGFAIMSRCRERQE